MHTVKSTRECLQSFTKYIGNLHTHPPSACDDRSLQKGENIRAGSAHSHCDISGSDFDAHTKATARSHAGAIIIASYEMEFIGVYPLW